ncbi:unnamed protein product [Camellia sinensis]
MLATKANVTRTDQIMWLMGTNFRYQYANSWFRQMDEFIHYVNMSLHVCTHIHILKRTKRSVTFSSWYATVDDGFIQLMEGNKTTPINFGNLGKDVVVSPN